MSFFELVEKPIGFSDRKLRTLAPSRLEATLLDTRGVVMSGLAAAHVRLAHVFLFVIVCAFVL